MLGLGTILSGLGAVSGILGNINAQKGQSKALAGMTKANSDAAVRERELAGMLMEQFKRRQGIADGAINSGTYDSERLVGRLDQDFDRNSERNLSNLGGALATMGYRPGDSEPGARLQAAFAQGLNQRNQQAEQLRQQSPFQILNLLTNAEGGLINRVAGLEGAAANRMYQTNANLYGASQPSDISGLLGSLMPYLNQRPAQSTGSVGPYSTIQDRPLDAFGALNNFKNQMGMNRVQYR